MNTRLIRAILVLALLAAACTSAGGGSTAEPPTTGPTAGEPVTTSTAAPTTTATTRAPTTTSIHPTTTTTTKPVYVWDGDPANLQAPIDHLDGFSFEFSTVVLTDDGPEGFSITGVYIAPDVATCEVADPELLSPWVGTIIAAGQDAWFDDDLALGDPQSRTEFADSLVLCPTAPEFWAATPWASPDFELATVGPAEEIDGYPTRLVQITAIADGIELTEGSMWVTDEGWPIRIEMEGSAEVEIGSDVGTTVGDEPGDFSLALHLTDIEAASLMVRSPDGTVLAGPLGDVTPTIGPIPTLGDELEEAAAEAALSSCGGNIVAAIIGDYDLDDLDLDGIRAESGSSEPLLAVIETFPGLPGTDALMTTSADGQTMVIHAELYFRDIAPLVALADWTGFGPESWWDEAGGGLAIRVVPSSHRGPAEEDRGVLVSWDGRVARFAEDVTVLRTGPTKVHDLSYWAFLHPPPEDFAVMSDEVTAEATAWLDNWVTTASEILFGIPAGDIQALVDLRELAGSIGDASAVACALLGSHHATVADLITQDATIGEAIGPVAAEIAAQNALVFIEYLDVIVGHLERPGVDWLAGDDVDLNDGLLAGNTDAKFLFFFGKAAVQTSDVVTPEGMNALLGL